MMVNIYHPTVDARVPASALIKCARRAWRVFGKLRPDIKELNIALASDEEVRRLNRRYRRRDTSTDVLSFDYGEIIISYATAKKQAKSYGHSLEKELGKLVVHGVLHILGFDHETKGDKVKMIKAEMRLLLSSGLIERPPQRQKQTRGRL